MQPPVVLASRSPSTLPLLLRRNTLDSEIRDLAESIELFADTVLVHRDHEEETSAGGIIVPESARGPKFTGEVIQLSSDCINENQLKPGDRILFAKYHGVELMFDNEPFMIMKEEDIIARLPASVRADRVR